MLTKHKIAFFFFSFWRFLFIFSSSRSSFPSSLFHLLGRRLLLLRLLVVIVVFSRRLLFLHLDLRGSSSVSPFEEHGDKLG